MASGFPKYILYENDGTTVVYEFERVTEINDFQDPITFSEHTSLRGQGSIVSEGSLAPWDINLTFVLQGDDYEDLIAQMNSLLTTIDTNTEYILKIDLTASTTKDYKVKRLQSFAFPLDNAKKRVNFQTVNSVFRVDSWG